MIDRNKLVDLIKIPIYPRVDADPAEVVADYLIDNDVIPVVLCEKCEYRHDSCFAGSGNTYCDFHQKYFPLNGFCSHGIQKNN
jgi:hypothetical protein